MTQGCPRMNDGPKVVVKFCLAAGKALLLQLWHLDIDKFSAFWMDQNSKYWGWIFYQLINISLDRASFPDRGVWHIHNLKTHIIITFLGHHCNLYPWSSVYTQVFGSHLGDLLLLRFHNVWQGGIPGLIEPGIYQWIQVWNCASFNQKTTWDQQRGQQGGKSLLSQGLHQSLSKLPNQHQSLSLWRQTLPDQM